MLCNMARFVLQKRLFCAAIEPLLQACCFRVSRWIWRTPVLYRLWKLVDLGGNGDWRCLLFSQNWSRYFFCLIFIRMKNLLQAKCLWRFPLVVSPSLLVRKTTLPVEIGVNVAYNLLDSGFLTQAFSTSTAMSIGALSSALNIVTLLSVYCCNDCYMDYLEMEVKATTSRQFFQGERLATCCLPD